MNSTLLTEKNIALNLENNQEFKAFIQYSIILLNYATITFVSSYFLLIYQSHSLIQTSTFHKKSPYIF